MRLFLLFSISIVVDVARAFTPVSTIHHGQLLGSIGNGNTRFAPNQRGCASSRQYASPDKNDDDDSFASNLSDSDQAVIGVAGTLASLVVFNSEFVLSKTGCGLPAGPFGVIGLIEGLSYLSVLGLVLFSSVKKFKTGSGLPAGPFGLLGAAEGLSFLAIAVGLIVLFLQVTNYGYIPNAVPMEGGMCN